MLIHSIHSPLNYHILESQNLNYDSSKISKMPNRQSSKSTLTIPPKTTKKSNKENSSQNLTSLIDEDLLQRIDAYVQEKINEHISSGEQKMALALNQDESKSRGSALIAKQSADLNAKIAAIPSLVSNIFNNHCKALISSKQEVKSVIINSSKQESYSSIQFSETLAELIPLCTKTINLIFPALGIAWL